MERVGLGRLKWETFAVAAVGLSGILLAVHLTQDPAGALTLLLLRLALLLGAILAFNEYVFLLVGRAEAALQAERQRLYALHQISESIAFLPQVERNLGSTLAVVRQLCRAEVVGWLEPMADGGELRCRVLVGERLSPAEEELRFRWDRHLAGRTLTSGRLMVIEDIEAIPAADRGAYPLVRPEGLRAVAAVCATVDGRPAGLLVLGWRHRRRLGAADGEFLVKVAHLLGVAVENQRLYQETERLGALQERARLAREMHDGFAQTLTYLKLRADAALLGGAARGGVPVLAAALEEMRNAATEALGDVRRTILDLKAPALPGAGDFSARLGAHVRSWSRLNSVEAEFLLPQGPVELGPGVDFQVLRICQEALANVRKHAQARRVWVRLGRDAAGVTLSVADDGRGFDPERAVRPGHFGLGILRERAAAAGGTLAIRPRAGGGTEVVLQVPSPAPAARPMAVAAGG